MSKIPNQTVLIVDDSPENITVLSELLQPLYEVRVATSGKKALSLVSNMLSPNLILLDVMMPDMDGYQVFEHLRNDPATADIPVIFLTAMDSPEAVLHGLKMGAVDYISKPIVPPILLARIHNQLELKHVRDCLHYQNCSLELEVSKRMAENELIQEVCIRALAHLAEMRDPETGNHILRTQAYVRLLATLIKDNPRFSATIDDAYINAVARSAPLHDIGKVGIPDYILLKPGKLSVDEWTIMKTHAHNGAIAIEQAEKDVKMPVFFLRLAKEIAHWHHEKWDGSGYPDGLVGDAIPISARIMALADVFDALISRRVYKEPIPIDEIENLILIGKGQHFDPDMVDAMMANFDDFCGIAEHYKDAD
ncbi:two-component system response regulator [Methylosoma difficile]